MNTPNPFPTLDSSAMPVSSSRNTDIYRVPADYLSFRAYAKRITVGPTQQHLLCGDSHDCRLRANQVIFSSREPGPAASRARFITLASDCRLLVRL